jgi:hypothetical protein
MQYKAAMKLKREDDWGRMKSGTVEHKSSTEMGG